jgi:hypothetical protein
MRKWKVRLFGLASAGIGYVFACGCPCGVPGLPCGLPGLCGDDLSIGAFADLIQDVMFGVIFD